MKTYAEAKTGTPSRAHSTPVPNALAHQGQLRGALLRAGVQPRLEIGPVNDPLEREADAAAGCVLRMAEPESVRSDGHISPKPPHARVQLKASATPASPRLEAGLNSLKNGGDPMDAASRAFFEPRFVRDFSGVRIHTDAGAARMADSLGAKAFTLGNDIAFARNSYSSRTTASRNLLGHELAHVVQQQSLNDSMPHARLVQRQTENPEEETTDNIFEEAAQVAARETDAIFTDKSTGYYYGSYYNCAEDPNCDESVLEEINCISFQMKPVEAYIRYREMSDSLPKGTWDAIRKATNDSRGNALRRNGKEIPNTDVLVGRDTVLMEELRQRAGFKTVLFMPIQSNKKITHYPSKARLVKGSDTGESIDVRARVDFIFTNRKKALEYLNILPFAILAENYGFHTLVLSYGWVYEAHWNAGPADTNLFEKKDLAGYLNSRKNLLFAVPPGYPLPEPRAPRKRNRR